MKFSKSHHFPKFVFSNNTYYIFESMIDYISYIKPHIHIHTHRDRVYKKLVIGQ